MKGIVGSVTLSQSAKSWRVAIGGKTYGANFDTKLDQALGKPIDFEWDDGKFGLWIKSWDFDRTRPTPAPQAAVAPPVQSSGQSNGRGDRYWLPFVSNQVAHAIAAGRIQQPTEMMAWAKAAYTAVTNLEGPEF